MRHRPFALVAVALLLAGCLGGDGDEPLDTPTPAIATPPLSEDAAATATDTPTPLATPTRTASPTPSPTRVPTRTPTPPLLTSFGDAKYYIGAQIEAGLYRARSATESCSWTLNDGRERHAGRATLVELRPSDVSFVSSGCGTWESYAAIVSPGQPFGEGLFVVGDEVAPGRYRASGAPESCSWAYIEDFRDPPSTRTGVAIADVRSSDAGFYSSGCGTWSSDLATDDAPLQMFGDGAYLVGVDIEPGRYALGAYVDACEWSRVSAFRGVGEDVIIAARAPFVDIEPGDAGFLSRGCGTWSRDLTADAGPVRTFGDGVYVVGIHIEPGVYRATSASEACEWWRSDETGKPPGGAGLPAALPLTLVDIKASDGTFTTRGCGVWTADTTPAGAPGQVAGDGSFLVGSGLEPGIHRATGWTESCVWMRLPDLQEAWASKRTDSGPHAVALLGAWSWAVAGSHPIVSVAPTDTAFYSAGCGTWSSGVTLSTTPGEPFGEGLFIVDREVAPGRYRATGASLECSWTVLYHLRGMPAEFWYRDWASQHVSVVDIHPGARAFHSRGCGTWSSDLTPVVDLGEPFGDGTYIVGYDIAPGRYRTTSPTASCHWSRMADFDGSESYKDLYRLAYDTVPIVDVMEGDAGFVTSGCGTWSDDLTPVVTPGQPFGDGGYFVGPEVAPGRYRAVSPSDACLWARLRNFEGSLGDDVRNIIAVGSSTIVEIAASDAAFVSWGCGTWSADLP